MTDETLQRFVYIVHSDLCNQIETSKYILQYVGFKKSPPQEKTLMYKLPLILKTKPEEKKLATKTQHCKTPTINCRRKKNGKSFFLLSVVTPLTPRL